MEITGREFELLCLCARPVRTETESQLVRTIARSGLDWTQFTRMSLSHRVFAVVLTSLESEIPNELPVDVKKILGNQALSTKLKNAFLVGELSRILNLLETHEIRALTLKGAALAQIAYGSVHRRPFVDLDILISPADFQKAKEAILATGYSPFNKLQGLTDFGERLFLWQSRQYQFFSQQGRFNLDLHLEVMPPLYDFRADFEDLYDRSPLHAVAGLDMRTFGTEDMLFVLCFHCVKNRWEQLKHVSDVAEFIRSHESSLPWDDILHRTVETQCKNIVFLALSLAVQLLGAPVPADFLQALSSKKMMRIRDEALWELSTQSMREITSFSRRLRDNMAIQDTLRQQAKYLGGALVRRMADLTSKYYTD